jgi:outer membrane protein assembly factor BamB
MTWRHAGLLGISLITTSCSPATLVTAAPGDVDWEETFDSGGNDFARDFVVAADGSTVYVTGRSELDTPDFATVAFDAATGAELWSQPFDGGRRDHAAAAVESPDGTALYVTGPSVHNSLNFLTIAYNAATGDPMWVNEYDSPAHRPDVPASIAVAPDGSTVFVSGSSGQQHKTPDYRTVAISTSDGSVLWSRRYGTREDYDKAIDVLVSPDGSALFVTGITWVGLRPEGTTIAYDAATGDVLWMRTLGRLEGRGLASSPDGNVVYAVGPIEDSRDSVDYLTLALSSTTGELEWKRRYAPTGGWQEPHALAVGSDGTVYVTGSARGSTTLAYSPTGQLLWATVSGRGGFGYADIVASPDASTVYVALRRYEAVSTFAYAAASGAETWVRSWVGNSTGAGANMWVGVPSDGSRLFVAGTVASGRGFDFITIAYEA